jgi:uncharacterized membrane protein (DUF2068 family)
MVVLSIANFVVPLIPGANDDVPTAAIVVGIILGLVGLPAAYGLWRCRKWAMIATIVVAALNFLSSVPGVAFGPNTTAIVVSIIGAVVSAATIVLVLTRDARASYV